MHGKRGLISVVCRVLGGLLLLAISANVSPCYGYFMDKQVDKVVNTWSRFDRFLSTFDPAGRYVRQPVERQIPALTFRGFLRQWSDVQLSGDRRVGNRRKDFRFSQMQNLLELELHYQVSPNIEITNINNFIYDGVYNWQDSAGLFASRTSETFRAYHNFERIVRELYVSYRTHNLDVVLGKQQIAWGKMDGQFIDVINGMDRRESVQLESSDYEWRRLPVWMANTTYFFGANSLNFLWIPNFEQDRNPVPGSPWYSPLAPPRDTETKALLDGRQDATGDQFRETKRPSAGDFGDHQYGLRLDVSMEPLTWGLIYYYAWNKNPTSFIVDRDIDAAGDPHLTFQPRFTRMHHLGITADYASALSNMPLVGELPMVLRVEGLWTKDVPFADFDHQQAARDGSLNSGIIRRDTLRAAIALEFAFPGNTSAIIQPSLLYTFDWRRNLGGGFGGGIGDEMSLLPVFFVGRPFRFTRDRLRLELTVVPVISLPQKKWQGIKTKFVSSYRFSQFVTGRLIYTAFSSGDRTDLYGQYNKWDNIGWELSYEF